jgi:hypothetical protein
MVPYFPKTTGGNPCESNLASDTLLSVNDLPASASRSAWASLR